MRAPVSPLFVPGDRPERFSKAAATDADAIIIDLEDAVDATKKGEARHDGRFAATYDSLAKYTRADIFQRAGEKTPAFVRFSTVAGSKGSFDLARDVRGFAVKLYTKEGNWDIVGNNIPVFFIQDAIKFPDMVHAVKQEPDRAFPQAQSAHDNFWDFISLTPESMHMIMWVMSDRAIPRSFRFMEGFGVHTFRFLNAKDESTFVKFPWKPVKINGADPDFHRRDLWQAIQSAISRNGSCGFSSLTRNSPTASPSTFWTLPRSYQRRSSSQSRLVASFWIEHAGQFLCRNRAGGVRDAECSARRRLFQ